MKQLLKIPLLSLVFLGMSGGHVNASPGDEKNLVRNPGFETIDNLTGLPDSWQVKTPRQELSPDFNIDSIVSHSGRYAVRSSAQGSRGTFGYLISDILPVRHPDEAADLKKIPYTAGESELLSSKSFRVGCFLKTKNTESLAKNILIRVNWFDKHGQAVLTEFLTRYREEAGWFHFEQDFTAPAPATTLRIELAFQWSSSGTVWWDDISVEEVTAPAPRHIKVASAYLKPAGPSSPEKNLSLYAGLIEEAGKQDVDILCLGEGITLVSTGKKMAEVAETIPGPTCRILGEAAKKSKLYVVAGIYERDGPLIYNTAILIDREGNVAGKYRKTHLPQTEVFEGLTPGTEYPVFKTDFGTIGIQICYDYFFPEVTRNLALKGAEIIMLPIWGDPRDLRKSYEIIARARAIDYSVYLVTSIYNNNRSLIIDPDGAIIADAAGDKRLAIAEINLDARTFERWLSVSGFGEWKSLYPKERRPETY